MPKPFRQADGLAGRPDSSLQREYSETLGPLQVLEEFEASRLSRLVRSSPVAGPKDADVDRDSCGNSGASQDSGCYRLRHVIVSELMEDGTLGLLLHGTSVVGFCSDMAEEMGWCIADQIVEVNTQRVSSFDEFLDRFITAQQQGFPIDFSVLRKELAENNAQEGAENALDHFFGGTSLATIVGQLHSKFSAEVGSQLDDTANDGYAKQAPGSESMLENPYIKALRKRRNELLCSAEGWATDVADSLASRLATERSDGLATLWSSNESPPARHAKLATVAGLPVEWFSCGPGSCDTEAACNSGISMTPRKEHYSDMALEQEHPWVHTPLQRRSHSLHDAAALGEQDRRFYEPPRAQLTPVASPQSANPEGTRESNSPAALSAVAPLSAERGAPKESKNFAQQLLASQ